MVTSQVKLSVNSELLVGVAPSPNSCERKSVIGRSVSNTKPWKSPCPRERGNDNFVKVKVIMNKHEPARVKTGFEKQRGSVYANQSGQTLCDERIAGWGPRLLQLARESTYKDWIRASK